MIVRFNKSIRGVGKQRKEISYANLNNIDKEMLKIIQSLCGQATISKLTQPLALSKRTLQQYLKNLIEYGYL